MVAGYARAALFGALFISSSDAPRLEIDDFDALLYAAQDLL